MNTVSSHKILALIPAYNEGAAVRAVAEQSAAYLPVLVVDDGSSDDTLLHARASGVEVLEQKPNQGKGAALRAGFRLALERGYEAVLTLDADGQHDPQEISAFMQAYNDELPDLIIGARDFSQMPPARRLGNSLGRGLFSWAMGAQIPDNQSGYRLISRRLMEKLLSSQQQGYEFEVEMIAVCVREGMRLAWVPIRTIYGAEKSHIQPLKHITRFFELVLRVRRQRRAWEALKRAA
ncbi:MAG: glycosyltransferase family 2 protein [Chloroflexi bacterium]|nr:glycosyltransferase family 2 protein [Chloroflexota bacterium]